MPNGQNNLPATNKVDSLPPAIRARLQKSFEHGNKQMQLSNHDYACESFIQCVLGDPGNLIYMQTYIGNLRIKYGNNKKGASFAFIKGGGAKGTLKAAEMRKKWEDVLKAGCESLKINPWDDSVFFSMGKACLELGHNETGLAYLKHAVECNPDDVELNRFAATELGAQQMYEQALACWQRVLNKKPDDPQAKRGMADLLVEQTIKKVKASPGGAKATAISEAEAEYSDSDESNESHYSKLTPEDEFEKRLAKSPNSRSIYEEMIEYFFQKGNLKKAEDACRRALSVFANDDNFIFRQAEIQLARAREELERTKRLYAKEPSDHLRDLFAKLKTDYENKRLAMINLRLARNPQSAPLRMELGDYLMKHGSYKEAIKEFQEAKKDQTIKGECLLALAFCFQQIKQYPLAMTHYEGAFESLAPNSEHLKEGLYQAARLAFHLENHQKANDFAHRLATIDFSYKDLGVLLDKLSKK